MSRVALSPALTTAAFALAVLLAGGVSPGAQAVVHIVLGLALVSLAASPDDTRPRGAAPVLAVLPWWGLPVLAIVGGGAIASGGEAWAFEASLGTACAWWAGLGAAVCAGAWAGRHRSYRRALSTLVGLLTVHAVWTLLDLRGLLPEPAGWLAATVGGRPVPRLVNDNHVAAAMVLGLPILGQAALTTETPRRRVLAGVGLLASLAVLVDVGSLGGFATCLVVLGLFAVLHLARRGTAVRIALGGGLLIASGAVALAVSGLMRASVVGRLGVWRAALRAWSEHPLVGVGAGRAPEAIARLRDDRLFRWVNHVHADPLEWTAEQGLLGLLAMAIAVGMTTRSLRHRRRPKARMALALSMAAIGIAGLVDFPMEVPAVFLAVMALGGLLLGLDGTRTPIPVPRARLAIGMIAALQIGCAAWMARAAVADRAEAQVVATPHDVLARTQLGWTAPWRPPLALAQLRAEGDAVDRAAIAQLAERYPQRADIQRGVGALYADLGDVQHADLAWGRAAALHPWDWRMRAARARLAAAEGRTMDSVAHWQAAFERQAPADRIPEAWAVAPSLTVWLPRLETTSERHVRALQHLLGQQGHRDGVALTADLAARMRPDPAHLTIAARAWNDVGEHAVAIDLARLASERAPLRDDAWREQARALQGLGRPLDAAALLRDASEQIPTLIALALQTTADASSALDALAWLDRQRLSGRIAQGDGAIAEADLRATTGDLTGCRRALLRSGLSGDEVAARCQPSDP